MKRKVLRHLGDGEFSHKAILLRDPEEDRYPFIARDAANLDGYNWLPVDFVGNYLDCIKLEWRRFYAYLHADGVHWDAANILSVLPNDYCNYWIEEEERERQQEIDREIWQFWTDNIDRPQQAMVTVEALIKY